MPNETRPLYILGVYISTRLKADRYHDCLSALSAIILKIKSEANCPYIILAGDFNRKDVEEAIGDYPDIKLIKTGGTRNGSALDLCATNIENLRECLNHPPLATQDGHSSDHNFLTFCFDLQHCHHFKWIKVKSRKVMEQAV